MSLHVDDGQSMFFVLRVFCETRFSLSFFDFSFVQFFCDDSYTFFRFSFARFLVLLFFRVSLLRFCRLNIQFFFLVETIRLVRLPPVVVRSVKIHLARARRRHIRVHLLHHRCDLLFQKPSPFPPKPRRDDHVTVLFRLVSVSQSFFHRFRVE